MRSPNGGLGLWCIPPERVQAFRVRSVRRSQFLGLLLMDDLFLTEREFSVRLKVPARTAQRWRSTGDGPPFVRLGPRRVAYREKDCEEWAEARTFRSRADELAQQA